MDPESAESWRQARKTLDFSTDLSEKGWFHSFSLPDGRHIQGHLSLEELETRVSVMPIPDDSVRKEPADG